MERLDKDDEIAPALCEFAEDLFGWLSECDEAVVQTVGPSLQW
ncbi:MAG: hypothetical protein ACLQUT_04805 [Thermoleophilia bacterium]